MKYIELFKHDMKLWVLAIGLLLLLFFAFILFKSVMHSIKKARFIEDTPTSKIRSAPQGYIELEGTAEPIPALQQQSPLTKRWCCWYSYQVEEYVTRRVGDRKEASWVTLVSGSSPHLFLLKDGTGECVISPLGAEILTSHNDSWTGNRLPEHLQIGNSSGKHQYRFTESRLEVEDELYALGHFETIRNMDALHHPEDFTPLDSTAADRKKNKGFRFIFLPQNQEIDAANKEWQEYQHQQSQAAQVPDHINVMRRNPATRQPYLLSNMSQKALARKYRFAAFGYSVFFLVVVVVFMGLWYFKFDLQLPFDF